MTQLHTPSTPALQFAAASVARSGGGAIDWHQPAGEVEGFIRALDASRRMRGQHQQPAPAAVATIHHRVIEVCETRAGGTMSSYPAGTITRCDDELWVQTGRGHLAVDRIVVDGVEQDAASYFVAAGFTPGDTFDTSHRWPSRTGPTDPRPYRHAA